jgi:putative inorganic carbon (HCO3(-)) transporter
MLIWWASMMGFRLWRGIEDADKRNLAVSVYLGLMTYFIHGVLNNYLDTDKASAPFWGFLALLVVMDLELKRESKDREKVIS